MRNPFRPIPVYIKFYINQIEMVRLDLSAEVSETVKGNFSSERLVIADFEEAERMLKSSLEQLVRGKFWGLLNPPLNIVVQQLDFTDGGLSPTERRILMNVAERIGGRKIIIEDRQEALTWEQAKGILLV